MLLLCAVLPGDLDFERFCRDEGVSGVDCDGDIRGVGSAPEVVACAVAGFADPVDFLPDQAVSAEHHDVAFEPGIVEVGDVDVYLIVDAVGRRNDGPVAVPDLERFDGAGRNGVGTGGDGVARRDLLSRVAFGRESRNAQREDHDARECETEKLLHAIGRPFLNKVLCLGALNLLSI